MKKMWHSINIQQNIIQSKKKEILPCAAAWMNTENIKLSEIMSHRRTNTS
jgi:hypothetical protein